MAATQIRKDGVVTSAQEALSNIADSAVVAISGFNMATTPEFLILELLESYKKTGHPRDLFIVADCCPAVPGRALDKVAEYIQTTRDSGLMRGISMPFFGFAPQFQKLITDNMLEAYSWPMGVAAYWFREIASGRPGVISKIGVETSTDPRKEGGQFNELAKNRKTCTVRRLVIDDEDYLIYEAPKPNVALVRGTTADAFGNVSMEEELIRGTVQSIVQATKANPHPGTVIVQVKRVLDAERTNPRIVEVPGPFIDYVVVAPEKYHWQSGSALFDSRFTIGAAGAEKAAEAYLQTKDEPLQSVVVKRTLLELVRTVKSKGMPIMVNLGIGIPALISKAAYEEKLTNYIIGVVESGQWGGVALSGVDFGIAINPFAISSLPDMFSNFEGGVIDAASLGFLQVEEGGDVNPSMLPGRVVGPGGFPVIAGGSPRLYFAGGFTAGATVDVEGGKLKIIKDGETKKFVKKVYRNFFSGRQALLFNKDVLYVTERAVFKLVAGGLELTELAPGVDLERDVLSKMEFTPKVAKNLEQMDSRIFAAGPMGLLNELKS